MGSRCPEALESQDHASSQVSRADVAEGGSAEADDDLGGDIGKRPGELAVLGELEGIVGEGGQSPPGTHLENRGEKGAATT